MQKIIGILLLWDRNTFFFVNGLGRPWLDPILGWPTYLGNTALLLGLILFCCWFWDRRNFLKTFPWILLAVGTSGVIGHFLKEWVHRARPPVYFAEQITRGEAAIRTLLGTYQSYTSFPSGHAVVVFAAVTAICGVYGRKFSFLYIAAIVVGVSRVYVGAHFPSDVFGGAVLGAATAWVILRIRFYSSRVFLDNKN